MGKFENLYLKRYLIIDCTVYCFDGFCLKNKCLLLSPQVILNCLPTKIKNDTININ